MVLKFLKESSKTIFPRVNKNPEIERVRVEKKKNAIKMKIV